jgi:hypothetical protein
LEIASSVRTPSSQRQSSEKVKVLNWIIALVGLWEFGDIVLPFIIGFVNVQAFVWNHVIVGMALVLAGARAGLASNIRAARTMNWMAAGAGLWLILAPFLLVPPPIAAGRWNDIIAGVIVFVLGVWVALALPRGPG